MKKKVLSLTTAVACFLVFSAAISAAGRVTQVFSEQLVNFGSYQTFFWAWSGNNSVVPLRKTLTITTATFSYFPSGGGTLGRADLIGRDANGNAVWRTQAVFLEPKKTLHLPFPAGLLLEEGGHVEVGFVNEGPGTIFVSLNGHLE